MALATASYGSGGAALRVAIGSTTEDLEPYRTAARELGAESLTKAFGIAEQVENAELAELLKQAGAKPPPPSQFELGAEQLRRFTGTFVLEESDAEGVMAVFNGILSFAFPDQPALALEPTAATEFRAQGGFPLTVSYLVAEDGTVEGFLLDQDGLPEPVRFLPKAADVAAPEAAASAEADAPAAADVTTAEEKPAAAMAKEPPGTAGRDWPAFRGPNAAGTARGKAAHHLGPGNRRQRRLPDPDPGPRPFQPDRLGRRALRHHRGQQRGRRGLPPRPLRRRRRGRYR